MLERGDIGQCRPLVRRQLRFGSWLITMNCASDVIISKEMRIKSWHLKEKSNYE
jgi:hypothetical protein